MKKILVIVFLVFSVSSFIAEIALNFRGIKMSYYSLNFEKNFVVKKFYYKYDYPSTGNNMQGGNVVIRGYLEGTEEEKSLVVSEKSFNKYRKLNDEKNIYYNVWYNKELSVFFFKETAKSRFFFNGLCLLIMWILSVPTIIYLIKNKKTKKKAYEKDSNY